MEHEELREEPLTIEDLDNEGTGDNDPARSFHAALAANDTSTGRDNQRQPTYIAHAPSAPTISHQTMLRQQAHAPVNINRLNPGLGVNANNISVSLAMPSRHSNPHLEDLGISAEQRPSIPEQHGTFELDSTSPVSSSTNGWSVVDTNGGVPPSARSLHAAALLNGVMYVFGGYDGVSRVNTFHAFSFAEKRWSPVLPSANSSQPPSPRDRHVAFAFGNSFYVQ